MLHMRWATCNPEKPKISLTSKHISNDMVTSVLRHVEKTTLSNQCGCLCNVCCGLISCSDVAASTTPQSPEVDESQVGPESDPDWNKLDPRLEPSTRVLIRIAQLRGCNVEVLDAHESVVRISSAKRSEIFFQGTRTSAVSHIAATLLDNKFVTKQLLREAGLRVPRGEIYYSFAHSSAFKEFLCWSIASAVFVKPNMGKGGQGVSFLRNARSEEEWQDAFSYALKHDQSQQVLVEEAVPGMDYRVMVVGWQVVGVVHRVPPSVTGDGERTIRQLVHRTNASDPYRPNIPLDKTTAKELQKQGLHFDTRLPSGDTALLRPTANFSSGGMTEDCTDRLHSGYKRLAVRAARALSAPVVGIDFMIQNDPSLPSSPFSYAILEANANPALFIHHVPTRGQGRNVAGALLDFLGL